METLSEMRPDLCSQWHSEKNGSLSPQLISYRSSKKVWWKCNKNHEWTAKVNTRTRHHDIKTGCPICNNHQVTDENCLATLNPSLAAQWDYEKNKGLSPSNVVPGSGKKVWWICEHGHSSQDRVCDKNNGKKCPICKSFAFHHPELLDEWDYEKNENLDPFTLVPGSTKKVWWKCKRRGHSWKTEIRVRTRGSQCPSCCDHHLSFPQVSIYYYLKQLFPDAILIHQEMIDSKSYEVDIYIPQIKLGIEYDGCYYHLNRLTVDQKKTDLLITKMNIIRVRELPLPSLNNCICMETESNLAHLEATILELTTFIGKEYGVKIDHLSIDLNRDRLAIQLLQTNQIKKNSLAAMKPILLNYWNSTKNLELDPHMINYGSDLKVWWKCKRNHQWEARIDQMYRNVDSIYHGCPICANKKLSKENQLSLVNPQIASHWHPTKNFPLTPDKITFCSRQNIWWQCEKEHEWQASPYDLSIIKGVLCPLCREEASSLKNNRPDLAKQWHTKLNQPLTPQKIAVKSNLPVHWQCEQGHVWQATIVNRSTLPHNNCPICKDIENNLFHKKPDLFSEWHPTKNNGISPSEVRYQSNQLYWWQCNEGHEWQATAYNRFNNRNCPFCHGKKVDATNSLKTRNPNLAKQWHPTKNEMLTSNDVTCNSNKIVWWQCDCEPKHEWQASVNDRQRGRGCPYCSGQRVNVTNSLATLNPILSEQWHPTKNGTLTPDQVTTGSGKKVWWQCKQGHEWQAIICERHRGKNCPYCENLKACYDNCLSTLRPDLSKQWHPTKNEFTSDEVVPGSAKKVWWRCEQGHEWLAEIRVRNRQPHANCPICKKESKKSN